MKKPTETDIDGIKFEPGLLVALRQAQMAAILAKEDHDKKTYVEMGMVHLLWQFNQNVQQRPKSAPAKLSPPKKKRIVRRDAFAGMEPIALPPPASKGALKGAVKK